MYLRLPDQYPYHPEQLRRDVPGTSFPSHFNDALLATYGVWPVRDTPAPAYDADTQRRVEGPPRQQGEGWVQTWEIQSLSPDEIAARLAARRAGMGVTPRQARLALQQAGLLGAVTSWIAAADEATRIEWEFALEVRRDWPPIAACAAALGMSDAALDGLFAQAVTL